MSRENHWKSVKDSITHIYSQFPTIFYYNYIEAVLSYRYIHYTDIIMLCICMHTSQVVLDRNECICINTDDERLYAERN